MVTSVYELDLPNVDTVGMGRDEALAAIAEARSRHWLARTPLGFSLSRQEDCVSLLRDRRFHNALSLLRQMNGMEPDDDRGPAPPVHPVDGGRGPRPPPPPGGPRLHPGRRRPAPALHARGGRRSGRRLRPDRAGASWWSTCASPIRSRSSANSSARPRRTGGSSRPGPPTSSGSSTRTWPRTCPASRRPTPPWRPTWPTSSPSAGSAPGDDLLSVLIAIEEEGDRLSTEELVSLAVAVLMAGTDTTRNQLACALALFAEYPDQWALLAERPDLAPRAVEETHALPRRRPGHGPLRTRGRRLPRRAVPEGDTGVRLAGRRQPGPRQVGGARHLRHHPGAADPADDLRIGHPPLHGRRPGPGRAAGGPGPAVRRGCRDSPPTGPSSGSRPPSASGDRPGSPCASPRPPPDGRDPGHGGGSGPSALVTSRSEVHHCS